MDELNSNRSINVLIKKLKTFYAMGKKQIAHIAYDKIVSFKRPTSMSILSRVTF